MCALSGTLAIIAVTCNEMVLLWADTVSHRQSLGVSLESLRSLDTALSGTTHDTRAPGAGHRRAGSNFDALVALLVLRVARGRRSASQ